MTTESTKVNILSQKVYQILKSLGFSKIFNETDFEFFYQESAGQYARAEWIAHQFIYWNGHEQSDFEDYEF